MIVGYFFIVKRIFSNLTLRILLTPCKTKNIDLKDLSSEYIDTMSKSSRFNKFKKNRIIGPCA